MTQPTSRGTAFDTRAILSGRGLGLSFVALLERVLAWRASSLAFLIFTLVVGVLTLTGHNFARVVDSARPLESV